MSDDPKILISPLSRDIHVDTIKYTVEIYRLEDQDEWTIEVIDSRRTSTVWPDAFRSDQDALNYVLSLFQHEGSEALAIAAEIIPFPSSKTNLHNSIQNTISMARRRD